MQNIPGEFDAYVTNATALFIQTNAAVSAISFEATYRKVREISGRLIPLSDDLVSAQREGFAEFIHGTQDTLARHNRLLVLPR